MRNINGRLRRLEQQTEMKREPVKPIKYWSAYTPEERAEMNGRVFWIRDERPENYDSDALQRQGQP